MQATTKYAIGVIILSALVTFTGNVFLGFLGLLAGGLTLSGGLQRSPDLIFMLSFFMAITTMMHLFAVLPFGFYLLGSQPERVCGISRAMVHRFEMPFEGATLAGGQGTVGYPWNMTESAQGHDVLPSYSATTIKYAKTGERPSLTHPRTHAPTHPRTHVRRRPSARPRTRAVSALVCGDNAEGVLRGFGALVVAFALFVLFPLVFLSMRLLRAARQAGGCTECMAPMRAVVVSVPGVPRQARAGPSSGYAGSSNHVPIAQAVPITQPASVKAAPRTMH